jgi:hypothetical protein
MPSRWYSRAQPANLKKLVRGRRALADLNGMTASILNQPDQPFGAATSQRPTEIENIVTTHEELFKDDVLPEAFANPAARRCFGIAEPLGSPSMRPSA